MSLAASEREQKACKVSASRLNVPKQGQQISCRGQPALPYSCSSLQQLELAGAALLGKPLLPDVLKPLIEPSHCTLQRCLTFCQRSEEFVGSTYPHKSHCSTAISSAASDNNAAVFDVAMTHWAPAKVPGMSMQVKANCLTSPCKCRLHPCSVIQCAG